MKSRTFCLCLAGWLGCGTIGSAEIFYQVRDQNGNSVFSNTLSPAGASSEVQRAREQAEIEYWRAVEAKARSQRNTPDTEVHRKEGRAFAGESFHFPKERSGKKKVGRGQDKMAAGLVPDPVSIPESAASKKVRRGKNRGQILKINSPAIPREKKRTGSRKGRLALK